MRKPGSKDKSNLKWYLSIGILGIFIFGFAFASFSPYSPLFQWWIPNEPATPDVDVSTFLIKDYSTELDKSNTTKCSVWLPLGTENVALWDEEDYLDIDLYNETIVEEFASEIEIDLTNETAFFFEIGSDDAPEYANMFILCGAGGNSDYTFFAYNQSEAINFNALDDECNEITVAGHQTNGTYLLIYGVPFPDTTIQAPIYNPAIDTLKDWEVEDPLTLYTDFFGFQFIFNDSIGEELDDPTHVNFTISEDVSASIVYDDTDIYIIFYEIVGFLETPNMLFYTIEYGADIELSDVDAVRFEVPEGIEGTFTPDKISDIV